MFMTENNSRILQAGYRHQLWSRLIHDMQRMDPYIDSMTQEELSIWESMITLTNKKQRDESTKLKKLIGK